MDIDNDAISYCIEMLQLHATIDQPPWRVQYHRSAPDRRARELVSRASDLSDPTLVSCEYANDRESS
jgi:hypothetical protein